MKLSYIVYCALSLSFVQLHIDGAKILLLSGGTIPSHIRQFTIISQELIRRGHHTTLIISSVIDDKSLIGKWKEMVTDIYFYTNNDNVDFKDLISKWVGAGLENDQGKVMAIMKKFANVLREDLLWLLKDQELYKKLESYQFDLAIINGMFAFRRQYILSHKLGIPYITFNTLMEPRLTKSPWLPSFVPHQFTEFTENMNFKERLLNTITVLVTSFKLNPSSEDVLLREMVPHKQSLTATQLVEKSEMWFIDSDEVIEYPRPLMPNMVNVGGLTMHPSIPLTQEFADFVSTADKGFIIMTFGSLIPTIPDQEAKIFIEAFEQLEQKVIWRYTGNVTTGSKNIKTFDWLPQNDLLGHPKARLFITHCGNNGIMEALYHSVPMLGFPLYADQISNGIKLQYRGFGRYMQWSGITAKLILKNIKAIMDSNIMNQNVKKASKILKGRGKSAHEVAADWTEYIVEHGGEHLRSATVDMPWYQILMLDILGFILLTLIVTASALYYIVKFVYRKIFKSTNIKEKVN